MNRRFAFLICLVALVGPAGVVRTVGPAAAWIAAQEPLSIRAVSFVDPDFRDLGAVPARVVVLAAVPESLPVDARSAVTLDVRLLGSRDRVVASRSDTFDFKSGQADLVTSVTVPRGRYRVEATLRAGEFKQSATTSVEIPDYTWAGLSMSDVVFTVDSQNVMLADAARGLLPVAPVARHAFSSTGRVSVFTRLHAGRSTEVSPVTMTVTIGKRGEKPVFQDSTPATPMRPAPLRTADYRIWLPLDQLTAGEWTLTLRARSAARHTATREIAFVVR